MKYSDFIPEKEMEKNNFLKKKTENIEDIN
jgi:hypothetical protein